MEALAQISLYVAILLTTSLLSSLISGYTYVKAEEVTKQDIFSLYQTCREKLSQNFYQAAQFVLAAMKAVLEALYLTCDQVTYLMEILSTTRPTKV